MRWTGQEAHAAIELHTWLLPTRPSKERKCFHLVPGSRISAGLVYWLTAPYCGGHSLGFGIIFELSRCPYLILRAGAVMIVDIHATIVVDQDAESYLIA